MKREVNTRIEFWNDWVRIERDPASGEMVYNQSKEAIEGYNHRTLGIARDERGTYYISAAIHRINPGDKEQGSSKYSGRGLVAKRIRDAMAVREIRPGERMVTLLPENYLGLVWEDPSVYNTLFGRVDPGQCRSAIRRIDRQGKTGGRRAVSSAGR